MAFVEFMALQGWQLSIINCPLSIVTGSCRMVGRVLQFKNRDKVTPSAENERMSLMSQTVTLELSDEMLQRYQRGAQVAHKLLEEFLVERLAEAAPLLADDLPSPLQEELKVLETLDDDSLWQVARSELPADRQRRYQRLLVKNSQGLIAADEKEKLTALGEEARRLTLKKAHAYMLLKWRGHAIPSLETLEKPQ